MSRKKEWKTDRTDWDWLGMLSGIYGMFVYEWVKERERERGIHKDTETETSKNTAYIEKHFCVVSCFKYAFFVCLHGVPAYVIFTIPAK